MIIETEARRIAIDTGLLRFPVSGISRYLRTILRIWIAEGKVRLPSTTDHSMGLFPGNAPLLMHAKRLLSSTLLDGINAAAERANLYWGPSHRLPLWLSKKTGALVTVHDLCWRHAPSTMRATTRVLDRELMRRAVERATRIVVVSQSTATDLVAEWPWTESKLSVTPLAASLPMGEDWSATGLQEYPFGYFLFVGTHEPRKNLSRLLRAYAIAGSGDRTWPDLVICGAPGWGGVDARSDCKHLGIQRQVRFFSGVSDEFLGTLYRNSVCLVLPSIYEGFGLPLVESMAQGRPVLTSNRASMPEVAADAGLLVDPFCVDSIAEGLRVMGKDERTREGLAARAMIRNLDFSWGKTSVATWRSLMEAGGATDVSA